jgi:hypothetical protein
LTKQADWPSRFQVTVSHVHEEPGVYFVLTWEGSQKALLLAQDADVQWYSIEERTGDFQVVPLGPAPRRASGTVDIGSDIVDRDEF